MAKAKLAFGVTAELELAVMEEVTVGGAEEHLALPQHSAAALAGLSSSGPTPMSSSLLPQLSHS